MGGLAAAATAAAAGLLAPTQAAAEVGGPGTPTVQAVAADATWLAYTPPPSQPGIVCMVDSGVDQNPDTEAAVIGGQAIAPETDTYDEIARLEPRVQPANHPDGHGTLMAMLMAAPRNGWGMVGLAPTSVRVYNMKALPAGQVTFPFSYYAVAIEDCRRLRASTYSGIDVVNLSLGGTSQPGAPELALLEHYVVSAEQSGLDVVAAAGNEAGPVLYPAAYSPVLAVGAGDAGGPPGTLCGFASHGEKLDLIAPGCDALTGGLDEAFEDDGTAAFGSGSSQASALASATLASMRAYAPALAWSQAEDCLTQTADDGSLDVAAAFDACGLESIVKEGEAAERAAVGVTTPSHGGEGAAAVSPGTIAPVSAGVVARSPALKATRTSCPAVARRRRAKDRSVDDERSRAGRRRAARHAATTRVTRKRGRKGCASRR